ncbi:DNA polymerase III subunit gamma/tau [Bacteroidota bacterium]
MENFIVSARKYRPDTFQSVVGQSSITQTLKNAIKSNHLAQAYLFCGPRGVGKTTCARIFAKTINCNDINDEYEACNQCESCKSFNESRSYNIHELDAASNNSVEDIRNLIDQVRIPPQIGKYSVYIIDEVHMLSQSAFNAFLKTLEEPPKHAIFILATTEKHKIIPTILSRCQIFDFNRIKVNDTVEYLEKIAKNEKVEYENEALNIIAQKADGAMRDALSIFDQVVSFAENNITYKKVIENLNVLDCEYYFNLIDAFLDNDITKVLLTFNEILEKGFDSHQFINGLSGHIRDILICKDKNTIQLLEVSDSIKDKYLVQSQKCEREFLYEMLEIVNQCDVSYKISNNKRLHVELALIKLSNIIAEKKKIELETADESSESDIHAEGEQPVNIEIPEEKKPEKINLNIAKESKPKLSIKDALNKSSELNSSIEPSNENIIQQDTVEGNDFTEKELLIKWNEFAEKIKANELRLANTLTSSVPVLTENFKIKFIVVNEFQKEAILKKENELLAFLKKGLKNSLIELTIEVIESEQQQKLYTQEDKFKHLADKNSTLNTLKQKFNLDFE